MISPCSLHGDHIRLSVRLTPNGGRDAVNGTETGADGDVYLKVRVTAVPEDGKANKALIAFISKALHLPKSTVAILSGHTARKKILRIEGDPEDLSKRLKALIGA